MNHLGSYLNTGSHLSGLGRAVSLHTSRACGPKKCCRSQNHTSESRAQSCRAHEQSVGSTERSLSPLPADKYSSQFGGGSQYAYFHEEDETSFQLVDTARTQKTAYQRNRMRFAQVGLSALQLLLLRISALSNHLGSTSETGKACRPLANPK